MVSGHTQALDSYKNGINKGYDGRDSIIKKIYKYTNKGADKIYFVTTGIELTLTNYWVYIEDAIQYCEVKPCKDVKLGITSTTGSVADELLKMKKLLDTGAITQVEYDAQKKKLLNQ